MVTGNQSAMGHAIMHNVKRVPQGITMDIPLPSSIGTDFLSGAPDVTGIHSSGLVVETRRPLTTILETVTFASSTKTNTIYVTDSASLSAIRASESSSSKEHASTSSADPATTSKAANKSSGNNNLSTLIPAIVIPVAILLVASFAAFWFIMRRRHNRQLKEEPQFVMAHKTEKPPISRGNSHSSGHSSTRELVPMSKLEKETAITTTEVKRTSMDLFPPKYTSTEIGVARPMTPPDRKDSQEISGERSYRNFSSVRPGGRSRSGTGASSQNATAPRSVLSPKGAGRSSPPKSARPPSPRSQGQPQSPAISNETSSGSEMKSQPRPGLGPIATQMDRSKRAPPPAALNPPTPTGAFNGASPISQYSPIIKGVPNINAATAPEMPSLKSRNLPVVNRGTDSPIDDNVLSHENMRIARLANSSRLGFANSPTRANFPAATNRSLGPDSKTQKSLEPSATSPQLPPPLTKDDLPPRIFARGPNSPAGGSSIYPSPSIGAGATPQLGTGFSTMSLPQSDRTIGVASTNNHARHVSAISRLSSDDGYVDMELDAKSDVSSLDDREKWELDQDRREAESQLGSGYQASGYGSAAVSPIDGPTASSASTGVGKPNIRDRDSEGPFVLSRY